MEQPKEATLVGVLNRIIPEVSATSVRMPVELVQELDFIAEKTGEFRNTVIVKFLEFAVAGWRKEMGMEK